MAKIMLVEDDNNLREIYEARLLAEGYEIISAKDGEEALALAVKERPDLIIADVMMPKVSGFDMLDILRSTPETRDTKVIMMTALSQAEDKARAEKLGADRYLVKSQVTLEDVTKVAREVLDGKPANPAAGSSAAMAADELATTSPLPVVEPPTIPVTPPADDPGAVKSTPIIVQDEPGEPATAPVDDVNVQKAVGDKKVITPTGDVNTSGPDLNALLAKEEAKENAQTAPPPPASNEPTVITPTSGGAAPVAGDPNSIAL